MRQYFKNVADNGTSVIWYEENGFRISFTDRNESNVDYQAYLKWVDEGNTAEEA